METNVIQKLQEDEETALDALGELAQKDSTEATIAEHAMINNSVLYKEFLAERQEILCHKWIESEKTGYDIGFERALLDWTLKYRAAWRVKRYRTSALTGCALTALQVLIVNRQGVGSVDGKMVDEAIARKARLILERAGIAAEDQVFSSSKEMKNK
jgi:hypothetical protein